MVRYRRARMTRRKARQMVMARRSYTKQRARLARSRGLLSIKQVAAKAGVSVRTVMRWRKQGLKTVRFTLGVFVRPADLRAFFLPPGL